MKEYPGAPFTGNIMNDLIMFLIIPTIFIILVVYMAVGRILPPGYTRMRALLGIGAYLFIIAGGYYSVFALLAGPYFIVLIFILGLLFFFTQHFTRGGGGGGGSRLGYSGSAGSGHANPFEGMSKNELRKKINDTEHKLKNVQAKIRHEESRLDKVVSSGGGGPRVSVDSPVLANLRSQEVQFENELTDMRRAMGIIAGKW
jgi:hypothetical protein